jgi:hypothetical protein
MRSYRREYIRSEFTEREDGRERGGGGREGGREEERERERGPASIGLRVHGRRKRASNACEDRATRL